MIDIITMISKVCTKCGKEYPATLDYFYYDNRRNILRSQCKKCLKKYSKEYRKNNPKYWKKLRYSEKEPRLQFLDTIHKWIKRRKPKQQYCTICNEIKKVELSNISGEYKEDIEDYQWLCHECHHLYDRIVQTHIKIIKRG